METRGLISSLFDISFTHLVTLKLVKAYYVIGMVVTLLAAILQFFVVSGALWTLMGGGFLGAVVTVVVAPAWTLLTTLLGLIILRVVAEAIILVFRIAEYLRSIDSKTPDVRSA